LCVYNGALSSAVRVGIVKTGKSFGRSRYFCTPRSVSGSGKKRRLKLDDYSTSPADFNRLRVDLSAAAAAAAASYDKVSFYVNTSNARQVTTR